MLKEKDLIHPTAIIEETVTLGENVEVGPYSVIRGNVKIGAGTVIKERVSIEGDTTIGKNNHIFAGAVIGSITQDKKYTGGKSFLKIGDDNQIREYVTINPGTDEGTETSIGNSNLFMAYSHVAHDCVIRNNATLANYAGLAGHVFVDDNAVVGGLSGVHQFVRIGKLAIIGGCSRIIQDIAPFFMANGNPSEMIGVNTVGLERKGYSKEDKSALKKAYKILFRSQLSVKNAVKEIENSLADSGPIKELLEFIKNSERGICS